MRTFLPNCASPQPSALKRLCAALVLALLVASCSDPQKEKLQHVAKGDQYAAEKRDEFAAIEYASAVKLDPQFGAARQKLAQTLERMSNLPGAFAEYIRAADALPNDRAAQIKAAEILVLSRRYDDAKARVSPLLAKDPKDVEALLLHANALAALQDTEGAIREIEDAVRIAPTDGRPLMNLGAVHMQTGATAEAEAAFRRAVELDPMSANTHLALANFLLSVNRVADAEAAVQNALARDRSNLVANRMLGLIFMATDRAKEAEQPLKAVAEISGAGGARLQLADYYVAAGRADDAASVLSELANDRSMFAEAEVRLAALDYARRRTPEAHKRIDALLQRVPTNTEALVAKTQWLTTEGKLDEALQRAQAAVKSAPQSAAAHFALAVVHDRRREVTLARQSYGEVLRLNPRAAAAQVALSRLNLSTDSALALRQAEEARQTAPRSPVVGIALVRSLIAAGNLPRATTELDAILKSTPEAAPVLAVAGTLEASKKNYPAARAAYERALVLSPGYLEAIGGLVFLDIQAKAPERSVAMLERELQKTETAPLLGLLARVHAVAGDSTKAERALRRSVAIDPRFTPGYVMLAQFFMQHRRLDEARAEFERIAERDPSAVGARTMVGVLLEVQGKRAEARSWYERTVNSSPDASVAANNLAFMYAEDGTNLDLAVQLASTAKQGLPDDPNVDDTLGWAYYKKDLPSLAVEPLRESLRKRPDHAETLYHLGLVYAKLGDNASARDALTKALKLNPKVGGESAQRTLNAVSR